MVDIEKMLKLMIGLKEVEAELKVAIDSIHTIIKEKEKEYWDKIEEIR